MANQFSMTADVRFVEVRMDGMKESHRVQITEGGTYWMRELKIAPWTKTLDPNVAPKYIMGNPYTNFGPDGLPNDREDIRQHMLAQGFVEAGLKEILDIQE